MSMEGYHKTWMWNLIESDVKSFISYTHFHDSWISFIQLLDLNYKDGFMCDICGLQPDTVIMDGIVVGLKKDKLPADDGNYTSENRIQGSK